MTFWLFIPQLVFGTDRYWTGATNSTWSTGTNWAGGVPPAGTGDNAVFDGTFTTGNQPNLTATTTAGGLWMTGSIGQNVVISGSTLTLQGNTINGTAGLGILMDNANAFTLTISAPLKLGAAQTWRNNSGGLLTISAGGVNTNNKALTIDGSGNTTISGVVSSGGTITKAGSGTLTLSGANTYGGATTVNAGTLIAAANNALGSTAHVNTVNSGATLGIQGGVTLNSNETISISGTGAAGRRGAIDNISGTNTIAGQITVATNSQVGVTAGALTLSGTVLLTSASTADTTVTFNPAASTSITVTGKISDQGSPNRLSFDQIGSGTVTIANGTNDYWGTDIHIGTVGGSTTGTLALGANNALSLANGVGQLITIYSGTLDLNNFNATINGLTLGGGAAGSTAAVTTGTGVLTLNNNVTYNATNNPLGATIAGKLNLGAATRSFTIGDSTNAAADLTVSAVVSGAVGLTKAGLGTMVLSGANTYSGGTTLSAGTLNINNATALGTGTFTINGGTIDNTTGSAITLSNNNAQAWNGNFAFTGTQSLNLGIGAVTLGATRTVTVNANNLTVGGVISGSGFGLTKAGNGTLTLSGANTYTGTTTINAGTLLVNGNNSSATGAVSVNNSGTTLGGTGTIGGAVTVGLGANLLGGTGSAASGTLTLANSLTLNGGSIIELALGASGAHSTLARTGGTWSFNATQAFTFIDLGAQATTYNNIITGLAADPLTESGWTITDAGWIGTFTYNGGNINLNVIAVPEPATYFAGVLTLGALLLHQRRRWRCLLRRHVTSHL